MGETDTDAADQFDAAISDEKLDEGTPGLWRRYRRLPKNVFAIGLVSLLNDASSEIIYPLLPVFLTLTLGASPKAVGLIEGLAESVSSLLKLFAGYFSDRRGKRKGWIVGGYALANFVRPLLGLATNWSQVLAIRLTDRVGKGIRTAPRDAMIADSVSVRERGLAFGFHRAMDHGGAVLGPLIGFLLITLVASDKNHATASDFKIIFLLASIPALAAVLVVIFGLREPQAAVNGGGPTKPGLSLRGFDGNLRFLLLLVPMLLVVGLFLGLFPLVIFFLILFLLFVVLMQGFDGNFKRFLVILALFTLSNSSDAFLLLRARDAGILESNLLLIWAALHGTKVLSSLIGGDLSDRLGRRTLIVSGWLLYAAVYLGFAFVSTPGMAWTLFLIYGVYFGLAEGAEKALVADLVRPEQRGTAYGLYNLAFGVTVFPASYLMGTVWDTYGPHTAFIMSAGIGTLAALLLVSLVSTRPEPGLP